MTEISPEPVAHLPQHKLVPLLARRANENPLIDLRMNHELVSFDQRTSSRGHSVDITVRSNKGEEEYRIQTSYLVGCEGAHSMTRKLLGITMDGSGTLQHLVNIYFTSKELGKALIESDRMGMLYFIFNRDAVVVLVAHNLGEGEFVAQVPYFPPLQSSDKFTSNRCESIIQSIAGNALKDVCIRAVKPWAMGAAVATSYNDGNIVLAGDAAHIVPPAGAFGMNTGVQDAHNLAWKLALSLKRPSARQRLLDSYEAERKPVAISNMNLSVDNFHEALRVARIIGLDFETAQSMNNVLNGPFSSWIPESMRQGLLHSAMSSGLLIGQALIKARQSELASLFESGQTLRLQYPKEDLGFMYHGPGVHVPGTSLNVSSSSPSV